MKKTFDFGKIDLNGRGRKINRVTVEIELRDRNGQLEFTACGNIWNSKDTDILVGGQCLDTIAEFKEKDPVFQEIYRLWKSFHLNTMRAGTKEQETEVKKWLKETGNRYDFHGACEHLKAVGLYETTYNNKPYRYGCGWIYEEIPEDDLNKIKELLAYQEA